MVFKPGTFFIVIRTLKPFFSKFRAYQTIYQWKAKNKNNFLLRSLVTHQGVTAGTRDFWVFYRQSIDLGTVPLALQVPWAINFPSWHPFEKFTLKFPSGHLWQEFLSKFLTLTCWVCSNQNLKYWSPKQELHPARKRLTSAFFVKGSRISAEHVKNFWGCLLFWKLESGTTSARKHPSCNWIEASTWPSSDSMAGMPKLFTEKD